MSFRRACICIFINYTGVSCIVFLMGCDNMIDINLNKVNKTYGFNKVLNNIDLTIKKGEKIALIGSNGCGKTTILKLIAGKENLSSGDISIRNNIKIGYLSQVPEVIDIKVSDYIYNAFDEILKLKEELEKYEKDLSNNKIINKYIKLQEKFINIGGYEYETKLSKVLSVFNISDEMLERNFNTLSGGEKTICSLIKILLINPDVLLLDEPTNHLDINKIRWLENYLTSINKTIIIVSHDRYFLDKVVNKIVLITKKGLDIYFGNYSYFIKENENRIMLEFKKYKDQQKQIEAMKKAIKKLKEFGKLCSPSGGEIFFRRATSIEKRLEKMEKLEKVETKKKILLDFNNDDRSGKDVLTINNLNLAYKEKILLENISFNIYYKDKICIIGSNGTGKSSLIKEIIKGNKSIKLGSNVKIGYIPQEIVFEDNSLRVIEEARKYFIGTDELLRSALFKFLFVGENIYKKIKDLSGGEKVRLKLFCLIQDKYNFLILDEPTNHIDIDTREILEDALISFNGTILMISHDRYFINKVCNQIIEIKDKKINKCLGNYDEYIKHLI